MQRDPALLERRMRFGPRAESRPRQKIIVAVIFAIFAALLIEPGLDHRFGWSQVPAAIVVLANLLIIAAFGFFLVVLRENTFAASTITVEAGQRVISTGPYAHVRHPMYAGAAVRGRRPAHFRNAYRARFLLGDAARGARNPRFDCAHPRRRAHDLRRAAGLRRLLPRRPLSIDPTRGVSLPRKPGTAPPIRQSEVTQERSSEPS